MRMTDLTIAQFSRLDKLGRELPGSKVCGWHGTPPTGGPIIRYPDGALRFINQHGRLVGAKK